MVGRVSAHSRRGRPTCWPGVSRMSNPADIHRTHSPSSHNSSTCSLSQLLPDDTSSTTYTGRFWSQPFLRLRQVLQPLLLPGTPTMIPRALFRSSSGPLDTRERGGVVVRIVTDRSRSCFVVNSAHWTAGQTSSRYSTVGGICARLGC